MTGSLPDTTSPPSGKGRHGYDAAGMPAPTAEEIREARERRRMWWGHLADDNVEHVAKRIENLLTGRRYTFVSLNTEHVHTMPEVRTGQHLDPKGHVSGKAVNVYRGDFPHIMVADSYGSWGMSTRHVTEAEANKDHDDPAKMHRTTYVVIEGGLSNDPRDLGRRDRIEVCFYNGLKQMLHWVIAVEPPLGEEEF
jgi:hypothetical protein